MPGTNSDSTGRKLSVNAPSVVASINFGISKRRRRPECKLSEKLLASSAPLPAAMIAAPPKIKLRRFMAWISNGDDYQCDKERIRGKLLAYPGFFWLPWLALP